MPTIATGGGSVNPIPMFGNVNAAQAALRNWVLNLNNVLTEKNILAAHVAIAVWIGDSAPAGFPSEEPGVIAARYWDLHERRDQAELVYTK